ncbi:UpxY family transcription antiterminator [Flavobacterium undicola]|uniref:UpxY family transcription antiterminator n=1 Tax=Flavobacterium undicola TaxID=1932779 RepID=UPI001377F3A6|nr:UpxY family transcription antiterminator [Flavobacterium undicola]MBA0882475.1 UpxY family transcription antiterminator [Flavobacterium undicola]
MKSIHFRSGWYVIYTKSNCEKKVYDVLKEDFDVFLPLRKTIRQWSDRKKTVNTPLFKSYIFVFLKNSEDQSKALKPDGAYSYITIQGKPAIVTDKEIKSIKLFIGELLDVELAPFEICIGEKRKINSGPFLGYDCFIVDYKGKEKVVVRIDSLRSCIIAEINKIHFAEIL